jgi:prepilin-type processing-associated H-X9-DG protein
MIHQNVKDIYYTLLYPVSWVLKPIYKIHYKKRYRKCSKAQIGCGKNYLEGFINIDANFQRKPDYLLDVRVGLPFPNDSLDFIYSCHMLEHVHVTEAISILKEWYRVLSPTGYIRLTLPDFEHIIKILAGQEVCRFPREFNSTHGHAINFLFCDGQHKFAYSKQVIEELALKMGFLRVVSVGQEDDNISSLDKIEPYGSFSVNIYKT